MQGTSYMPAIVVPVIPLLARVKANACKGLVIQLRVLISVDGRSMALSLHGGVTMQVDLGRPQPHLHG